MPLNKGAGNLLFEVLNASGLLQESELTHDFGPPSTFCIDRPGYVIWRWGEIRAGERSVLTATYLDADGTGVILTVMAGADKKLTELELWKGDGTPVARLPTPDDLVKMVSGRVYD
jgi:hypothetical protein